MEEAIVAGSDLGGVHVHAALIGEGVSQDISLVEQAGVGLLRRQMPEVVEHLVPEPGVQQVQNGMFHAAHVKVHSAGMVGPLIGAGAHPVTLYLRVYEDLVIVRIEISQLIPA